MDSNDSHVIKGGGRRDQIRFSIMIIAIEITGTTITGIIITMIGTAA